MPAARCAVCNLRAHHQHHVCYRQHVEKHGGDPDDPRNLMPLCFQCHGAHHGRSKTISIRKIPPPALEFAKELLGDYAADYLARYYSPRTGEDYFTTTVEGAAAHARSRHKRLNSDLYE